MKDSVALFLVTLLASILKQNWISEEEQTEKKLGNIKLRLAASIKPRKTMSVRFSSFWKELENTCLIKWLSMVIEKISEFIIMMIMLLPVVVLGVIGTDLFILLCYFVGGES